MNLIHNHILVGLCRLLYQKTPLIPSTLTSPQSKYKVGGDLVEIKNIYI
jgi:hypothetical protein